MGKRGLLLSTPLAVAALALAAGPAAAASSTASGVKKARWGKNVTVTYGSKTVRVRSNGIPNHSRPTYYAVPNPGVVVPDAGTARAVPDPTRATSHDFRIPLKLSSRIPRK